MRKDRLRVLQAKDKKLHGAAMTSFVKKCAKDAMAM